MTHRVSYTETVSDHPSCTYIYDELREHNGFALQRKYDNDVNKRLRALGLLQSSFWQRRWTFWSGSVNALMKWTDFRCRESTMPLTRQEEHRLSNEWLLAEPSYKKFRRRPFGPAHAEAVFQRWPHRILSRFKKASTLSAKNTFCLRRRRFAPKDVDMFVSCERGLLFRPKCFFSEDLTLTLPLLFNSFETFWGWN